MMVAWLMVLTFTAGSLGAASLVRAAADEGSSVEALTSDVPANTLRVHYQRADQQYGDMGLWLWGDVAFPSEELGEWPTGAVAFSNLQTSDYGAYMDVPLKANAAHLNFIVLNKLSGVKDANDKYVSLSASGPKEVWIKEGSDVVSLEPPSGPSQGDLRIYYQRTDGQYEDWGLWLWDDVAEPSEEEGSWPEGASAFSGEQVDDHGAYIDVALNASAQKVSFIVVNRVTGDKDGVERTFNQLGQYRTIYLKQNDPGIYTSPAGDGGSGGSEAHFPEWSKDSVIYEVNVRQYTEEGTFAALEAHLPRLKELGVEILWLMPIHPISEENRVGTLGSYYAVADYKGVNPEFGTMADFQHLVDRAHELGFKVMLDWVANHTGWDHPWIQNKAWYVTDGNGEIVAPDGWTDVAELNFNNADMRAAMIDALTYWVEEADIDGYRADFASGVPQDFWEDAREALDAIKPVYMLAEDDTQIGLLHKAFNSNYNMGLFYNIMKGIPGGGVSAQAVRSFLEGQQQRYPAGSYPMNYITNHDTNSWEGTVAEMFGPAEDVNAVLSFTVPGMPLIYSGQEAGLDKRLEFFEKDEIDWSDLSKQAFYQTLVHLKKNNSALWNGEAGGAMKYLASSDSQVLAFEREKEGNRVIVLLNLSGTPCSSTVQLGHAAGTYQNVFDSSSATLGASHTFNLAAWGYQVFTQ